MQTYQVRIDDDNIIPIEANSPEDARKIVKGLIATREISPYTDKLFFDYEEGVPNINRLRSLMGRTDKFEEREAALTKVVGSGGFTYDSKGLPAITHEGLKRLGLREKIKFKTLPDGTKIPQNIIVDERSFGLSTGDLADFSGVVGPILGTLAFLTPHFKIAGALQKLIGGKGFASRIIGAGLGSATGKGAEELLDASEGIQIKERDELANLLQTEFALGAIGQSLGEAVFLGYSTLLGKQAPFDNLRFYRQTTKGRSIIDIKKLDQKLGREATEKEINAAVKRGDIEVHQYKAIPSQSALNRKIPGRLQAVSEQVLGNKRELQTKSYLFAELNKLARAMNGEDIALDRYVSSSVKGELDEQVASRLSQLRGKEADVNKIIDNLFDELTENALAIGNYKFASTRQQIGQDVMETLRAARKGITAQTGKKYAAIDEKFANLSDDVEINAGIQRAMNEVIDMRLKEMEVLIKNTELSNPAIYSPFSANDNLPASVKEFKGVIAGLRDRISRGEPVTLQMVRNVHGTYRDIAHYATDKSMASDLLNKLVKLFDSGADSSRFGSGSILTDFADEKVLVKKIDGQKFTKNLTKEDSKKLADVIEDLRQTNALTAKRLEPFDKIATKKVINNMKDGSFDADEVYLNVIQNGKANLLDDVFRAIKDHDSYLKSIGKEADAVNEGNLRKQLQRRLFLDAYKDYFDPVSNSIDFTKFVRSIDSFEGRYPGKLDILFPENVTEVRNVLGQINRITPNIFNKKPQELLNLIDDITKTESGLTKSGTGREFLEKLTEKAEAAKATTAFEQNAVIRRLPTSGVDEVADVIFRPNSGANINIVKETVTPEVFSSIQEASMTKLLRKSINVNSDKITDIFKPGNLKSALDAYGDDTLNAMFGKEVTQGLKAFQKAIDIGTIGEVGRGGAAGTLVAAGIAVNALSIGMLPTVAGLAIMRSVFSRPGVVRLLSKKDPGSIARVIQIFERTARQLGIRLIFDTAAEGQRIVEEGVGRGIEELDKTDLGEDAQDVLDQSKGLLDDAQEQFRSVLPPVSSIEMPEVGNVRAVNPTLDPLSQERLDFAERLSNRPII